MKIRFAVSTLVALVATLLVAPGAGAAVTLGSNLSGPATDAFGCSSTCTVVQSAAPGLIAQAPTDGVIVRWRIKTDGAGGPFALQVARPGEGDARIGVATSNQVSTVSAGVSEFATRLSVQQGDNVGLNFTAENTAKFSPDGADAGFTTIYFLPGLVNGQNSLPDYVNLDTEFLVNADLEPDADRDGFGDESQDKCVGVVGGVEGCPQILPNVQVVAKWRQRYDRVALTLSTDRAVQFSMRGRFVARVRRKLKEFKPRQVVSSLGVGQSRTFKMSFTRAQRAQIGRLLKSRQRIFLTVSVKVYSNDGFTKTIERKIRLKL